MALPAVAQRRTRFESEMQRLWRPSERAPAAPPPPPSAEHPPLPPPSAAAASAASATAAAAPLPDAGMGSAMGAALSVDVPGGGGEPTAVDGALGVTTPTPLPPTPMQRAAMSNFSVASLLPSSHAGPFPLEPTPLDVSVADRETLASQFAEARETMYCIAAVRKVGERSKRSERTLAIGEHRLIVLKPRKRGLLASTGVERSRQRVMFWHELLSCAGSAGDRDMLRICFIPQHGRYSALPSLFLAKLVRARASAGLLLLRAFCVGFPSRRSVHLGW